MPLAMSLAGSCAFGSRNCSIAEKVRSADSGLRACMAVSSSCCQAMGQAEAVMHNQAAYAAPSSVLHSNSLGLQSSGRGEEAAPKLLSRSTLPFEFAAQTPHLLHQGARVLLAVQKRRTLQGRPQLQRARHRQALAGRLQQRCCSAATKRQSEAECDYLAAELSQSMLFTCPVQSLQSLIQGILSYPACILTDSIGSCAHLTALQKPAAAPARLARQSPASQGPGRQPLPLAGPAACHLVCGWRQMTMCRLPPLAVLL